MYCKKCGTEQKPGQKFCPKCGTPFVVAESPADEGISIESEREYSEQIDDGVGSPQYSPQQPNLKNGSNKKWLIAIIALIAVVGLIVKV